MKTIKELEAEIKIIDGFKDKHLKVPWRKERIFALKDVLELFRKEFMATSNKECSIMLKRMKRDIEG